MIPKLLYDMLSQEKTQKQDGKGGFMSTFVLERGFDSIIIDQYVAITLPNMNIIYDLT